MNGLQLDFELSAKRNCAMSPAAMLWALGVPATFVAGVALVLAALGVWLVLPFAGLEIVLLAWAYHENAVRALDYESIGLRGAELHVEVMERGVLRRWVLNAGFSRSHVELAPGYVSIGAGHAGPAVRVGRHRDQCDRRRLAHALARALVRVSGGRSPSASDGTGFTLQGISHGMV